MATILVVDDDPLLLKFLTRVLKGEKHEVFQATNGNEAIRCFQQTIPDLIILDIELGNGLNGFEVCKRIREDHRGSRVNILFLSGNISKDDMLDGLSVGGDDYIYKPFQIKEFKTRVGVQLANAKRRSQKVRKVDIGRGRTLKGNDGDKYEILYHIASGGMGTIYRGQRLADGKPVAIKTFLPESEQDYKSIQRFLREAKATLSIENRFLAKGIEVVCREDSCFFVMEFVEGENLEVLLSNKGKLSPIFAASIIQQIAYGLQYLYENGLIHRDIKPGNILVQKHNAVLVDLGLSKSTFSRSDLTTEGIVLGTPYYLSPEQALGEEMDIRSDLYSLGASFFQILTGEFPFHGASTLDIISKRLYEENYSCLDVIQAQHPMFYPIIRKMMARYLDDRYQVPAQLAYDLQEVIDRLHFVTSDENILEFL